MRIASLLPSATEIVCALGSRPELVGRSHECDFPAGLEDVPILTSARIEPLPSSEAIDRAVRSVLRDALAIYRIDLDRLRDARPDAIVTQDLCDVCAVSLADVRDAVARLTREDVAIVSLRPTRLEEIWADILRVGEAIGRVAIGLQVVARLRERVARIQERAAAIREKPSVLTIEWISPVMIGGMWMPELVSIAGGTPLVTRSGEHAPTLDGVALAALDPDVVVVKPCGFHLSRTMAELEALRAAMPPSWRARVYVADGNAYFNRPGPRIVESLEIMAACVHPHAFADFAEKHATSFAAVWPRKPSRPKS